MNILRNNISFLSIVIIIILISLTNSCKLFHSDDGEDKQTTYKIAFLRDRNPDNALYNDNDLWIMDMDGSNQTQLTYGIDDITDFLFSPDGEKICFKRTYSYDNSDIYLMNSDGSNIKNLTNDNKYHSIPIFTGDGHQLIYSTELTPLSDIFVMNIDGSSKTNITNTDSVSEIYPKFIPIENRILYRYTDINATNHYQLYTMNLDGSDKICITCQYGNIQPKHHQVTSDGEKILFLSTWPYIYSNSDLYYPLYIFNTDGSNLETIHLFDISNDIWDIQLAPKNEFVLYSLNYSEFHRIDIDGENEMQLTKGFNNSFAPDISYYSKYITFTECNDLSCKIYVMDSDGSNQQYLTEGLRSKFQPLIE